MIATDLHKWQFKIGAKLTTHERFQNIATISDDI